MSMSSQWAKRGRIASWLSWSAAAKVPSVASGRLRSMTVTSWRASAFFIRMARYRPAGPPPTLTIRIKTSAAQASMAAGKPRGKIDAYLPYTNDGGLNARDVGGGCGACVRSGAGGDDGGRLGAGARAGAD